jgi:hypothetical protein
MAGPFKMKGFSGFGNSPMRQDKKKKHDENGVEIKESKEATRFPYKAAEAWTTSLLGPVYGLKKVVEKVKRHAKKKSRS